MEALDADAADGFGEGASDLGVTATAVGIAGITTTLVSGIVRVSFATCASIRSTSRLRGKSRLVFIGGLAGTGTVGKLLLDGAGGKPRSFCFSAASFCSIILSDRSI